MTSIRNSNSFKDAGIDWVDRYGLFDRLTIDMAYHMEFASNRKIKEISVGMKYNNVYLINIQTVSMINLKVETLAFIINIADDRGTQHNLESLGLTRVSLEYIRNLINDLKKKIDI